MLLPSLTRQQHATVLHALMRITGLGEQVLTEAFIDADMRRVHLLDPSRDIRQAAYRTANYGARHVVDASPRSGETVAGALATTHRLSPTLAGIILGAAVGLRLGLVLKRRGKSQVTRHKPRRATAAEEAATAKRWARDVGKLARKGA